MTAGYGLWTEELNIEGNLTLREDPEVIAALEEALSNEQRSLENQSQQLNAKLDELQRLHELAFAEIQQQQTPEVIETPGTVEPTETDNTSPSSEYEEPEDIENTTPPEGQEEIEFEENENSEPNIIEDDESNEETIIEETTVEDINVGSSTDESDIEDNTITATDDIVNDQNEQDSDTEEDINNN